jgi:hypothetical protein
MDNQTAVYDRLAEKLGAPGSKRFATNVNALTLILKNDSRKIHSYRF